MSERENDKVVSLFGGKVLDKQEDDPVNEHLVEMLTTFLEDAKAGRTVAGAFIMIGRDTFGQYGSRTYLSEQCEYLVEPILGGTVIMQSLLTRYAIDGIEGEEVE